MARSFIELLKGFGLSDLDDAALIFQRACQSDEARVLLLGILQASKSPAVIQFDLSQSGHSSVELKSLPRPFRLLQATLWLPGFALTNLIHEPTLRCLAHLTKLRPVSCWLISNETVGL